MGAIKATPAVIAALSLAQRANAASLYWDLDPLAGGSTGTTANGVWDDATTANWNSDSAGGTTPGLVVWSSGSTAVFSASNDVTGTSNVTVSGTITSVNGITFEEGTVRLTQGTLTLTGANLTQSATNATISGVIAGAVGINKLGANVLFLNNTGNTFTNGVSIGAGTLAVDNDGALGNAANGVTFTAASTLRVTASTSTSRAFTLNGAATIDTSNSTVTTIAGAMGGTSSLTKSGGTGTLVLTGTNSYAGNTTVSNGNLWATVSAAVPNFGTAGKVNIGAAGTLTVNAGAGGGDWTSANIDSVLGAMVVTAGGSFGFNVDGANSFSYGTNMTTTAAVVKTGTGTLSLTGNNTYTTNTTVSAGTLRFMGTGFSDISISSGAFGTGTGTLADGAGGARLTVTGGGTFSPGDGGIGTFTADEATFNQLCVLNYEVGAPGTNDRINVTDPGATTGLALPASAINNSLDTINITDTGGLAAGTYSLIGYNTTYSGSINSLQVVLPTTSLDAEIVDNVAGAASTLNMVTRTASAGTATWAADANGTWSTPSNWTGIGAAVPNGVNAVVNFGGAITASRTIAVTGSSKVVGTINLNSASSYVISGMVPITMDVSAGNAAINDTNGSHTIDPRLQLNDTTDITVTNAADTLSLGGILGTGNINKLGAGTLQVKRQQGYTGTITNNSAGALDFNLSANNTFSGNIAGTGALKRSGGNTLTIAPAVGTNAGFSGPLTIAGGTTNISTADGIGDGSATNTITVTASSTLALTAAMDFSANRTIAINAGTFTISPTANSTVAGVISGAGALAKAGAGILVLTGTNSYSGGTTVSAGALNVAADNNLGAAGGGITMAGGTLEQTVAFNVSRNINVTAASVITGIGNETLSGVISGNSQLMLDSTGVIRTITLSGVNTKTGVWMVGTTPTVSSSTPVVIVPTNDQAFGPSGAGNEIDFEEPSASSGTYSRVNLTGGRNINKDIILRGAGNGSGGNGQILSTAGTNTWSGKIFIGAATSNSGSNGAGIGANAGSTLLITGQIDEHSSVGTGTRGVIWGVANQTGIGTVALWPQGGGNTGNKNSTFSRLFDGTLELWGNGALGDKVDDGTSNPGGNTIDAELLLAGFAGDNPILAFRAPPSSSGFNYSDKKQIRMYAQSAGAASATIANLGGDNTFGGTIVMRAVTLAATSRNFDIRAGSLTLQSPLYADIDAAAMTVNKLGPGELILTGVNNGTDGLVGVTFTGLNQEGITGGTFAIQEGTLTLSGAGEFNGGMAVNMSAPTTLKIDNTAQAKSNRIISTISRDMNAGGVHLFGHASTATSETITALNLTGSMSNITVSSPGALTTLNLSGALSRSTAAVRPTAMINRLNNSTSVMNVGAFSASELKGASGSGSLINIVPWLAVDDGSSNTNFVTVNNGAGGAGVVRPLTGGEYIALASGNATNDNTSNTGSISITADTQVNSVKVNAGSSVAIGSGKKIYVFSGAVLSSGTGSSTISGGELTFHHTVTDFNADTFDPMTTVDTSNEGIVTVPSGATLNVSSNVSGTDGLTKSGAGTLYLTGTNSFGETIPVGLTYPGHTAGRLSINAGTVQFDADANLGHASAQTYLDGGTLSGAVNGATSNHGITLASTIANNLGSNSGVTTTYAGIISGGASNHLYIVGPGIVRLTNAGNTYAGNTFVQAGYLQLLDTDATLAPARGTLTVTGGSLRADTTQNLSRDFATTATGTTAGFYVASGQTLTCSSIISGSGNLALDGGGTVSLGTQASQSTYAGSFYVNNGTLNYTGVNGLGALPGATVATYWTLSNGSTLRFDVASTDGTGFSSGRRGLTVNSTGGTVEVTGSNAVNNNGGVYGSGTVTKTGTGTFGLRTANPTFTGKWNVSAGVLEFGASSNNALSLGNGTGADFITIQNGATLRQANTATTGTLGASQGITLAGASSTIEVAGTATSIMTVPGDITAGNGKSLIKAGPGILSVKNFRGDALNVTGGVFRVTANGTNTGTSTVTTVSTSASTQIDLTNNKLIVSGEGVGTWNGTAYGGVSARVVAGRNTGNWDGTGIVTSQSNALPAQNITNLAVAAASAVRPGTQTFGGIDPANGDTLVMYTYNGDANLSGNVDSDDYFIIDSNYNKGANTTSNTVANWAFGDFNYDGKLDGDDYAAIDAGFSGQGAAIAPGAPGGVTAVPEPASFAVVSLAAMGLLGRRRRKL